MTEDLFLLSQKEFNIGSLKNYTLVKSVHVLIEMYKWHFFYTPCKYNPNNIINVLYSLLYFRCNVFAPYFENRN